MHKSFIFLSLSLSLSCQRTPSDVGDFARACAGGEKKAIFTFESRHSRRTHTRAPLYKKDDRIARIAQRFFAQGRSAGIIYARSGYIMCVFRSPPSACVHFSEFGHNGSSETRGKVKVKIAQYKNGESEQK